MPTSKGRGEGREGKEGEEKEVREGRETEGIGPQVSVEPGPPIALLRHWSVRSDLNSLCACIETVLWVCCM